MATTIFVGGLENRVQAEDIERAFGRFGRCTVDVGVPKQGEKCFAFAKFESARDAERAIREMAGRCARVAALRKK